MKEKWGIDIDEVKFETLDAVLDFHDYTINGVSVSKDDISDYHIYKIQNLGIDVEYATKWWEAFTQSPQVNNIKPVQGAKEILEVLQSQGKEFVDITGRRESWKQRTEEALQKHYPTITNKVIYLNAYADRSSQKITQRTKSEICKEIGATVMVEDDLHYAQELADNGIKVYLLDKPRNKQYHNGMHPNIIKIHERKNILQYI